MRSYRAPVTLAALTIASWLLVSATPAQANLEIMQPAVVGGYKTIDISFRTNEKVRATAKIKDTASDYSSEQIAEMYVVAHEFHFNNIPESQYVVTLIIQNQAGQVYERSDFTVSARANGSSTGNSQRTGPNGGPCGGTNGDGSSQPPCSGPLAAPATSEGTTSSIGYPFILDPQNVPDTLIGPTIRACNQDIAIVWVGADRMTGVVGFYNDLGERLDEIAFNNVNPIVVQLLPVNPGGSFWIGGLNMITPGGRYTVKLENLDPQYPGSEAARSATLVRPTTQTDGCGIGELENFLASAGVSIRGPGVVTPDEIDDNPSDNRSPTSNSPVRQILLNLFDRSNIYYLPGQSTTGGDAVRWLAIILLGLATANEAYFFTKRRRLWGVIYDARSKQPVELAVVRLFDQEHHKLLETRVTPKSGRYSFLAEPGEYYLEVTKEGYHFPTRIVAGSIDNEYVNLYRGEILKLHSGQSLIAPDIPVDSESGAIARASFFRRIIFPTLDRVRLPLILATVFLGILVGVLTGQEILEPSPIVQVLTAGSFVLLVIDFLFVRKGRK